MRIIGVDPGTVTCGYGIIELGVKSEELSKNLKIQPPDSIPHIHNSELRYVAAGDIRMNRKEGLPRRLLTLHASLKSIITEYNPSSLCIEKIFYHKSIRSAMALGYARGVIMLLAAEHDLRFFEYNSTELKMALTGYGRAEKSQVQSMVKRILNIGTSEGKLSEDTTDALALCICHINSSFQLK